jgi:hypothetical protein
MAPPTRNMMKLNHRYIVPMSLWLVVVTQRIKPVGGVMIVPCVVSVCVIVCCHENLRS